MFPGDGGSRCHVITFDKDGNMLIKVERPYVKP